MALSLAAVRAALDDDTIQIVINGTSYQDWQKIDVDSDIFTPADGFQVEGVIPALKPTQAETRAGAPPNALDDFREGQACDVYVGLDRQMAGVIDDVEMSSDRRGSKLVIRGRDKGAFLVDGETKHIKASKYTIKTLVEALLDPSWGIRNVLLSNEDNRKLVLGKKDKKPPIASLPKFLQPLVRARTKVDHGQSLASILDQRTRQLGITWWLTAQGDIFLGKPNYQQQAAYHFSAGASPSSDVATNVESWRVLRSASERYSELKVAGQGWPDPKRLWDTNAGPPKYNGLSRDPDLVERGIVRKLIVSEADATSNSEAQQRADWEMGKRRLRALVLNVTVPGFRQNDRLYAVDTIATVKIEEAGIDGTFYVTQRKFTEDRGRRRTSLTLHETKVWLP
jgi:prophage tail gpP-like protein